MLDSLLVSKLTIGMFATQEPYEKQHSAPDERFLTKLNCRQLMAVPELCPYCLAKKPWPSE